MNELHEMPDKFKRRFLILRVMKADAEQVEEVLSWGASANWCTKGGMPAIIRLVTNRTVMADVVKVLLKHGADPNVRDKDGLTALDHARRRLVKYEGKPRTPLQRSSSLTAGGELRLDEDEWKHIDEMKAEHAGAADIYLHERRKAAERVFDDRGNLERIVEILEPLAEKPDR
jgi:hypothetical protein